MGTARSRIAVGLVAALLALAPRVAAAAPVTQESFKFIDHNFGAGDQPFGLVKSRDGKLDFAVLASVDDKGAIVAVGFATAAEWQRFVKLWQEAKVEILAPDNVTKGWDLTDGDQTKLTITTTIYGSLLFNISQSGAGACMFFVDKDTEPGFDAAVAKISAWFKAGH